MVDVAGARGRPPVKWQNRVLEFERGRGERRMSEPEHARTRINVDSSSVAIPLGVS